MMGKLNRSRVRLSIWFVLGIAVCITLSGLFQTRPKAQDISPQTTEEKTQPSDELDRSFSTLLDIAGEKGAVRVIFGLRLDGFRPIGELEDAQREKQQADIKTVQNDTLGRLLGYNLTGVKQFEYMPYLAAEVDVAALEMMRQDPQIVSIQEDKAFAPSLAESTPLVGAPAAWTAGYTGYGWTVGVLDTGVDKSHAFLSGKVLYEACYSTNSVAGNTTSVCPGGVAQSTAVNSGVHCGISGCGHGTHVAGIAVGTNANFSGVARDGNVIAVQVFTRFNNATDCNGAPPCVLSYSSDQILGLERVLALRTSVNLAAVNMSLGGGQFTTNCDTDALKPAIDNLRSFGVPTVIASGNSGFTNALGSPACISSAVSVGSTGDGSGGATVNVVSSFSNSASFLNLLAPGQLINSSMPGGVFSNLQGTSMAAPHVAGAWAVLKQKKPTATVTEVLNAFTSTGLSITDTRNGIVKPRIRVDAALAAISTCFSTPIAVGQTLNGNLQSGDCLFTDNSYYDAYTFSGTAGQQIAISMNSSQFNAYLLLYQGNYPGGAFLVGDDNGGGGTNARIPAGSGFFTVPATGTYTILANSFAAGQTGAYSLSLSASTCSPAAIPFDQNVSGDLQSSDCLYPTVNAYFDAYTFSGTAGEQISIAMNSTDFDAYLHLYQGIYPGGGTHIASDDDGGGGTNARIPAGSGFFTLPATGTYTIVARSYAATTTGAYLIRLSRNVVSTCSPAPITVGQNLNGILQSTDCVFTTANHYYDAYTFSGTGGQQIAISMNSTQFNAFLLLYQGNYPGGTFVASNDDGGGGTNARIPAGSGVLTLPATATYTILAAPQAAGPTGAYSISLSGNVVPSARRPFDFDGDSRTDLSIFRPGPGEWWVNRSSNGSTFAAQFGASTDRIVPADYTGDARTDIAVWRASNGNWIVLRSEDFSFFAFPYGTSGDIPAPGDFDADGLADTAVFRPSTSTWYIRRSSDGGSTIQQFGIAGDVPVTADYDGDGRADIAIYRPSLGQWWIVRSMAGTVAYQFGNSGDRTVQGDYTGDGKADIAFWRPSTGTWYVLRSENTTFFGFPYGTSTDIPSPGDYDGDGKYDGAVFRPSTATWYVNRSSNGTSLIQQFGATGDLSVPNSYVR